MTERPEMTSDLSTRATTSDLRSRPCFYSFSIDDEGEGEREKTTTATMVAVRCDL